MPANPKYLNNNPWQRFAKLSSGLLGGYFITALLHLIASILLPFHKEILVTSIITFFIIWCVFIILPYIFKNGWKVWLIYLGLIVVLGILYYLIQPLNPFVHG